MRLHVCFRAKKHRALLTTCELAIAPGGCVLVFYTHHRPHLAHRDMEFFDMAQESGWKCDKVLTERFPVRFSRLFGSLVSSWDLNIISSSLFSPCSRRTQARRRCARPCMGGKSHERKMLGVYYRFDRMKNNRAWRQGPSWRVSIYRENGPSSPALNPGKQPRFHSACYHVLSWTFCWRPETGSHKALRQPFPERASRN